MEPSARNSAVCPRTIPTPPFPSGSIVMTREHEEHSQKHWEWSSVPLSSVPDATIAESLLNSIGNSFPS
jgi:hypothetical protein